MNKNFSKKKVKEMLTIVEMYAENSKNSDCPCRDGGTTNICPNIKA